MENSRNSYLISKAIQKFLIASILTMAISQLNVTVDGIIVSHLIGPDAMAAINLFTPVSLSILSVCTFLGIGATILAARYTGEHNQEKTDSVLSTAIVSIVTVGLVIAVAVGIFQESLIDFICLEDRLRPYFHHYAVVMLGCSGIVMLNMLFNKIASTDGKPELVAKAVTVSAISNMLLDYLFIAWFDMGISGSAWASVLAALLNLVILAKQQIQEHRTILTNPLKNCSFVSLKENLQQGTPMIVANLILMFNFFMLNNIIQRRQGADGVFVLSICMNLLSIGMMFGSGIGSAVFAIGSFLKGQKDYQGLRILVNKCIGLFLICLFTVVAIIQIYPQIITRLFGADTPEMIAYANGSLRIFSWMLPTFLLVILLANVYQMLGFLALPPVLLLTFPLVLLPSLWGWAEWVGNASIWYAFPETGFIIVALTILITEIIRLKKKGLSHFTLVPIKATDNSLDISIQANIEALRQSLDDLYSYLSNLQIDDKLSKRINVCLEEVMLNIVTHSGRKMENHYFDLHISIIDGMLVASVKDDGQAFNPLHVKKDEQGVGLKILYGYCEDLSYKYMYGQNMTFMNWKIGNESQLK